MNQRYRYPDTWKCLAEECKARANYRCECCGIPQGTFRVSTHYPYNMYLVTLHAAHVHHDQENPDPVLMALCPTCHARYYRKPVARPHVMSILCKRRRAIRARHLKKGNAR